VASRPLAAGHVLQRGLRRGRLIEEADEGLVGRVFEERQDGEIGRVVQLGWRWNISGVGKGKKRKRDPGTRIPLRELIRLVRAA